MNICPLVFHGYDKDKGKHTFGMIDFQRKAYKAKASLECNGVTTAPVGSDICQSQEGLFQRISFEKESIYKSECSESLVKEGFAYRIKLKKGLCLTTFLVDGQFFRLTTYGFEKALIY